MLSECIYKVLMASGVVTSSDACDLSGAIEAAVLEAQGKQEPVAWAYTINNSHSVFSAEKPPEDAYDEGTLYPLYAAPVVQPDMVMVPREPTEAMLNSCWRDYPEAARETWRAMIAAAEGKSNAELRGDAPPYGAASLSTDGLGNGG